eukprot:2755498-Prymnesium_polylepis.1
MRRATGCDRTRCIKSIHSYFSFASDTDGSYGGIGTTSAGMIRVRAGYDFSAYSFALLGWGGLLGYPAC